MNTLITQYLKEIKASRSPATFKDYSEYLTEFAKGVDGVRKFTRQHVVDYVLRQQGNGKSNSQISHGETVIHGFYSWLVANDVIPVHPLAGRKIIRYTSPQRPPDYPFTEAEYGLIKARCMEMKGVRRKWWLGAVIVAWHTGLRLADVTQLQWESINLQKKSITLIPQKTKRLGKTVEIPIAGELFAYLVEHFPNGGAGDVFPWGAKYYRQDPNLLTSQFRRIVLRCGIKGKSFHAFRHTYCSRLLGKGVPVPVVASMTGHTIKVLERYSHISFEDKMKALEGVI